MNKKGGTMIEAALVFPLIILTLMAIIGILMFLFEAAAAQAELHQAIRTEAGHETGTYHGQPGSTAVATDRGMRGIYSVMNGKSSTFFQGTGLLQRSFSEPLWDYQYLTDERKYARAIDFFLLEDKNDGQQSKKENE